jgi:uncharacterized delta-60 repeat protein
VAAHPSVPAVLASALALVAASAASAAPGDLDRSFGDNAIALTDVAGGAGGNGVALQPNGKIVVVGAANLSADPVFLVVRFTQNGKLDPSFGGGDGIVRTPFPGSNPQAQSVAIEPDGDIVVAGGTGAQFAVARYQRDGDLDQSFSGNGKLVTSFPGGSASAYAVAVQPNGRIVAGGDLSPPSGTNQVFALARYLPEGRLDPSFGTDGLVLTPFGGPDDLSQINALAVTPQGIVAGGVKDNPFAGGGALALARYGLADGALDPSFGGDGKVETPLGQEAGASALAKAPGGRIVAGGGAQLQPGQGDRLVLARYLTGGSLDSGFGEAGIVTTPSPTDDGFAQGLVRQPSGQLVLAGTAYRPSSSAFMLARYLPGGQIDSSFGGDGIVTTQVSPAGLDSATGVVIQPSGRIVATGQTNPTSGPGQVAAVGYQSGQRPLGQPRRRRCANDSPAPRRKRCRRPVSRG